MAVRHRYSSWDGTQDDPGIDVDDSFGRLAEDVFHGWDLESALRRLLGQGLRDGRGRRLPGLESLIDQLRRRRQRELEHFNLEGLFRDIKERLDRIVEQERRAVGERSRGTDDRGDAAASRIRQRMATARERQLDALPPEPGSAIRALQAYEFLDQGAAQAFQQLVAELRDQMVGAHLREVGAAMRSMAPDERRHLGEMVQALTQMLREHAAGRDPHYQEFMARWGRFFPDHPATIEEFWARLQARIAAMQSLLRSLPATARREVEALLEASLADPGLEAALGELGRLLRQLGGGGDAPPRYRFFGDEPLPFGDALGLLSELQAMEELERALRQAYQGEPVPEAMRERLRATLGADATRTLDRVQALTRDLERAGHLRRGAGGLELTPRGIRRIGQKALQDIFRRLAADRFGQHPTAARGAGGDRIGDTHPYRFGDPFDVHLGETILSAVRRGGGGVPVRLDPEDFVVHASERTTRSSTVLMLDMSRSMPLRGYFYAAKKVAMALDALIRTQYPRDHLYVVGFSDYARQIPAGMLAQLSYNEYVYGTNLQHGLLLARRLLGRHPGSNRQVIIVSDGEPTAHMEGSRAVFYYPPLPETFKRTLEAVRACTRDGIVINTFMLETNQHLVQFVRRMTRQNRGRAFFISPDRLGDYVLLDYVAGHGRAA
ncbi:MAG TPA: VWA domain-containing protein [Candidatus Micrarchaeia archaeon]|nr:VWA domain-containing protein [Candidatus Micrarchaeia archaeon]